MKLVQCFYCAVALLLLITGSGAAGAAPAVEGTPIPITPKPDFSQLQYLMGSWTCTDLSSRRPGPFTTTQVFSMDPSGYWIIRNDTIHRASWIPAEVHSQTKITYDRFANRMVRITTGDLGGFAVSTAGPLVNGHRTWTYIVQTKAPDVSSYAPEVNTKVSDTKRTMTTSFTENNGRVVNVKETCIKS